MHIIVLSIISILYLIGPARQRPLRCCWAGLGLLRLVCGGRLVRQPPRDAAGGHILDLLLPATTPSAAARDLPNQLLPVSSLSSM